MTSKLAINAIYMATEGEGIHIGTPQIFVRFQGCNIGCINCDSKDTWEFTDGNMNLDAVVARVEELAGEYPMRVKRVSITGGDPLHPKHVPAVLELSRALKKRGYFLNLEAAGTRIVHEIFDVLDFISFDFKTPSTGVKTNQKLIIKLWEQYRNKAQIKSVIATRHDFEAAFDAYQAISEQTEHKFDTPWVLTPCYEPGDELPKTLSQSIVELNHTYGAPFRVILQQHKVMYTSDFGDF
ncbi:MAG: 7-carboxy-7-deazaguanine synthase QueE [Bacteriovoracaceae bacterium]|nr:7-carboxy-7-deazaguanine synthase QueE [Bacteriovoracaceae bacterium]